MARIIVRATNDEIEICYARAFFLTPPDVSPLSAGESRRYPIKYDVGIPAATAFEIHWYATRADAVALMNRLTDTTRLPTATFEPATPNDATGLQDGVVVLTAPTMNGYENPVGVIEMVQDTGEYIKPHIYLLEDVLVWDGDADVEYRDYAFRYWIGEPPIRLFSIEWYRTRIEANLRVNRLTDESRLPRAMFTPAIPNRDAGAEEVQDGTLRLYPASSDNPYLKIHGLLCVTQIIVVQRDTAIGDIRQQGIVYSNWNRGR